MNNDYIPGMGKPSRQNRKVDDERVVYLAVLGLLSLPVVALYLASNIS